MNATVDFSKINIIDEVQPYSKKDQLKPKVNVRSTKTTKERGWWIKSMDADGNYQTTFLPEGEGAKAPKHYSKQVVYKVKPSSKPYLDPTNRKQTRDFMRFLECMQRCIVYFFDEVDDFYCSDNSVLLSMAKAPFQAFGYMQDKFSLPKLAGEMTETIMDHMIDFFLYNSDAKAALKTICKPAVMEQAKAQSRDKTPELAKRLFNGMTEKIFAKHHAYLALGLNPESIQKLKTQLPQYLFDGLAEYVNLSNQKRPKKR